MLDIWIGDVNLTLLVAAAGFVLLLPCQLLLCFRSRSLSLRLAPAALAALAGSGFFLLFLLETGWDRLPWMIFAFYSGFLLLVCGLGWLIWGGVRLLRRR